MTLLNQCSSVVLGCAGHLDCSSGLYCGQNGHFTGSCPLHPGIGSPAAPQQLVSLTHSSSFCSKRFLIQASLCSVVAPLHLSALVDSRSEDNFVDYEMAQQAGFLIDPLETPMIVRALDGKFLTRITHQTTPLQLILSGNR